MNASALKIAAAMILLAAPGCTRVEGPPADDADQPAQDTSPPADAGADAATPSDELPLSAEQAETGAPAEPRPVTVRVIDEQEFDEVLAGYGGDVVLVDFWAMWCIPCVELFPHTVALHERFAEEGLRVVSVSFDQPESESAVLDFLKDQGATFDNFISRYGMGIQSSEKFGLPGPVPQLRLYDREGELVHTFPEPQSPVDPEAVDRAVEELLGIEP